MNWIKNQPTMRVLHGEQKAMLIEHLNEEHQTDLIEFAQAFVPKGSTERGHELKYVKLVEIYQDGIELSVEPLANTESDRLFIAFSKPISDMSELQHQYIDLKQQVDKKQGKETIKLTTQQFRVRTAYQVTAHMWRLELVADDAVLAVSQAPGYAYLFDLQFNAATSSNSATPCCATKEATQAKPMNSYQPRRSHVYYTLRKAFLQEAADEQKHVLAWVDVYLHQNANGELTCGGRWATSLQTDDRLITKREFPERIDHLREGQALLIADETALPTVARLLELWQNPIAPLVICVTHDAADQHYLSGIPMADLAKKAVILPLVINPNHTDVANRIDAVLEEHLAVHPVKIEKVWGALESSATKALRRLLNDRLKLPRTDCVLKVYWRAT